MAVTNNLANNTLADAAKVMENFNDCLQEDGSVPMNNNIALQQKDSSGTARDVAKIDSADGLTLGNNTTPLQLVKHNGWNPVLDTWTYASATTITVPSGAASIYQKGDKIKLTQTTVKYFSVVDVADTVLTVTGGSDYTVTNAAITSPFYSKAENPQGWPTTFNFAPALYASVTPPTLGTGSIAYGRFSISGNLCHYKFRFVFGTSSAAGSGFYRPQLPVNAASPHATANVDRFQGVGNGYDDNAAATSCFILRIVTDQFADRLFDILISTPANAKVNDTSPWAWTTSDELDGEIVYEI